MSQISFFYPNYIFLLFVSESPFFFIFCEQLDVVHVLSMIDIFLRFCKFVDPFAISNSNGKSASP